MINKILRSNYTVLKELPTTIEQKALWYNYKLNPDGIDYNVTTSIHICSSIEIPVLENILREFVKLYPTLRAIFSDKDGEVKQTILKDQTFNFEYFDVTEWNGQDIAKHVDHRTCIPFNLEKGPLFNALLIKRAEQDFILTLMFHHIICDSLSIDLMIKNLVELYNNKGNNLLLQKNYAEYDEMYSNYIISKNSDYKSKNYKDSKAFWLKKIEAPLPLLNIPLSSNKTNDPTKDDYAFYFELDNVLTGKLKDISKKQNISFNRFILTSFQLLLYYYSGQNDILTGLAVSTRDSHDQDDLFGYFVNQVVIRSKISDDNKFNELLNNVNKSVDDGLKHKDVPFPVLIKEAKLSRVSNRHVLFQASFNALGSRFSFVSRVKKGLPDVNHIISDDNTNSEINISSIDINIHRQALNDILLTIAKPVNTLQLCLSYNTELFARDFVESFANCFKKLLAAVSDNPAREIKDILSCLNNKSIDILDQFNLKKRDFDSDCGIHNLFERHAISNPAAIALSFDYKQLTHKQLNETANKLSHYLISKGVKSGDLVGLCIERSHETIIGLLAIIKAGAVYVPLDPHYPHERICFMLKDCGASFVLTKRVTVDIFSSIEINKICFDTDWKEITKSPVYNPDVEISSNGPAYIIYTSGSTGVPKGVMATHSSLCNLSAAQISTFDVMADSKILQFASLSFDASIWEIVMGLCSGAQLVIAGLKDIISGTSMISLLKENCVTHATLPPSVLSMWQYDRLPELKVLIVAGEKCPENVADKWSENRRFFNAYGPTETTVCATISEYSGNINISVIGYPLINAKVYILNDKLEPVPLWVQGELYIGGTPLTVGYINLPDLTSEKFLPDPFSQTHGERIYKTGDLARCLPDGSIEYIGRADQQVKIRGFRIELGEIESVLSRFPNIKQCVAAVKEIADGKIVLAAYIIPDKDVTVKIKELRSFLGGKMPDYMIPEIFSVIENMPLSPTGKIEREKLPDPSTCRIQLESDFIEPGNELEQKVVSVWKMVLGDVRFGIHDKFFDLGGHSLLLLKVQHELEKLVSYDVTVLELLQHPTVSMLADYLSKKENNDSYSRSDKSGSIAIDSNDLFKSIGMEHDEEDIAVIGMACRFPGADNIESFRYNLENGISGIKFFSREELLNAGVEPALLDHPDYVPASGYLDGVELFDAKFFGFNANEAAILDPQQRVFLECAWESLEMAGHSADSFNGKIGIYAGAGISSYLMNNLYHKRDFMDPALTYQIISGNDKDFLSTRVAYKLNLQGPAVNVQTACSTSLVAVHKACQSLVNGECDMALAGGVSIQVPQKSGYLFQDGMILSPDGYCRAFDSKARGTVLGSGAGIVVLRPLKKAIEDGDNILAVIKGSAINNDGALKIGFTAPSIERQADVVADALNKAKIKPETISFVEAHGTGTEIGDPAEIEALTKGFKLQSKDKGSCAIGSVKTNIGHLDAAAGIAGLIKSVLAVYYKQLPPSLNYKESNSKIEFDKTPFFVNSTLKKLESNGEPVRAGIGSFGIGGTNAYVVIEEAPVGNDCFNKIERPLNILTLSAISSEALNDLVLKYQKYFENNPTVNLADVCFTANSGRKHFDKRCSFIAGDVKQLNRQLSAYNNKENALAECATSAVPEIKRIKKAFLFSGRESQYINTGRELYETHPYFKEIIDECNDELLQYLDKPLIEILYPIEVAHGNHESKKNINETIYTQPALFALEYALAKLWQSWNIVPDIVTGHGFGEYVAACIAGVFSLKDGLKLVVERAKLMQRSGMKGSILSVSNSEDKIKLIEPALNGFIQIAETVKYSRPNMVIMSNVTGKVAGDEIATPEYWIEHSRKPELFSSSFNTMFNEHVEIFLEIGSENTLLSLGLDCFLDNGGHNDSVKWIGSLNPAKSDWDVMLNSLGELYNAGSDINWKMFDHCYKRRRLQLPTYSFQHKRYWVEVDSKNVYDERVDNNLIKPDTSVNNKRSKDFLNVLQGKNMIKNDVILKLKNLVNKIIGAELSKIDLDMNLFHFDMDSLMLVRFRHEVEKEFHVRISMSEFYDQTDTLNKIVKYIYNNRGDIPLHSENEDNEKRASLSETGVEPEIINSDKNFQAFSTTTNEQPSDLIKWIMKQQLEAMTELTKNQLEALSSVNRGDQNQVASLNNKNVSSDNNKESIEEKDETDLPKHLSFFMNLEPDKLSAKQESFLGDFITRFNIRTKSSKSMIQKHRPVFADWINAVNFRFTLKELLYPTVVKKSDGARIWDIDDNEYIDIAMGYGVNFLGHRPPYVVEAIENQLKDGFQLGPQFHLTCEVAELVCELSGAERVAFTNTGTEADMVAMRIARAVTGRKKIAIFKGSYHGMFDGILVKPGEGGVLPAFPGTTPGMVEDVLLLDYGSSESLEIIRSNSSELAAVLVEPVQSRRPGFHPAEFLKELRQITEQTGVALIFDEIITGFRICMGGAQEYFGVKADIVTYGKALGGGMPISIVAGKAKYLNAIDGGAWDYGDDSYPESKTTMFAGTFCKHPLTIAGTLAALKYIKEQGPSLQERINQKTIYLTETLNEFFRENHVPIMIKRFGSLFRFESFGRYDLSLLPIEMEILFFLMLEKGVYTWERRICFISDAHTDEDIEYIIKAFKECVFELRKGGFTFSTEGDNDDGGDDDPGSSKPDSDNTQIENSSITITVESQKSGQSYPMSSAQKRLYALSHFDNGDMPYHLTLPLVIDGELDISKADQCFQTIVKRHESLRTSFEIDGNEMVQVIRNEVDFKTHFEKTDNDNIDQLISKSLKPFDMSKAPLLRVFIYQLKQGKYLLVIDAHHIAADGISWNVIIGEFNKLYQGQQLLPVSVQYKDHTLEQQNYFNSKEFRSHEHYWQTIFGEGTLPLELPLDFTRPPRQKFEGGVVHFQFDSGLVGRLNDLARNTGTTLNMILFASYITLLNRLSGQEDITVGVPVSGRNGRDDDDLVGMVANTVAVRVKFDSSQRFDSMLNLIKKGLLDVYENSNYPFEFLAEKFAGNRDVSRNPLFDVTFVFENGDERIIKSGELVITPIEHKKKACVFDMTLEAVKNGNDINLSIEYSVNLFKRDTIERWCGYYENIVRHICNEPAIFTAQIDMIPDSEKEYLLRRSTTGDINGAAQFSIINIFENQVSSNPDNIAISCGKKQLTYKELNQKANKVAHFLQEKYNLKPDELVGICLTRSEWLIIGILGVLKSGAAYVPVDHTYPAERKRIIFEQADCSVILSELSVMGALSVQPETDVVDIELIDTKLTDNPTSISLPGNLAYVIFTSGSTGKPKGCQIEMRSLFNYLTWAGGYYFDKEASGNFGLYTSISFDLTITTVFLPLLRGRQLYIFNENLDIVEMLKQSFSSETPVDSIKITPAHILLLNELDINDTNIKLAVVGGEALTLNHVQSLKRINKNIEIYNEYGPTEATVGCIVKKIDNDSDKITIGLPITNTTALILDKNLHVVPTNSVGELFLGGESLARGYLNDPELTREKFLPSITDPSQRIYKTGDLARWNSNHEVEFLGRNDNQVKIKGYRIEPEEIEHAFIEQPGINEALVITIKSKEVQELAAYFTSDIDYDFTDLRNNLKQHLPEYMIPLYFVRVDKFQLNSNGKIDRKLLPDPLKNGLHSVSEFKPPGNLNEEILVKLWEDVLDRENVGITDDYFALGGDSIKAIQLIARLARQKLRLKMDDIFETPTIEVLAKKVTGHHTVISQEPVTGEFPVTALQKWLFVEHKGNINHFCQAVILSSDELINIELLKTALINVQTHHDELRAIFSYDKSTVVQECMGTDYQLSLIDVDLTGDDNVDQKIEDIASAVSGKMDISSGPLLTSVLIRIGNTSKLLLVVHHLVIDAVSLRILIEDINLSYSMLAKGEKVVFPEKSISFMDFSKACHRYIKSDEIRNEKKYWQSVVNTKVSQMAYDKEPDRNIFKDMETTTIELSVEETDSILTNANKILNSESIDIFLTALARVLNQRNCKKSRILLETHGRDAIKDLDTHRSVGWFTSIFPHIIEVAGENIYKNVKHIREGIKAVPNKGNGYALCRYLLDDHESVDFDLNPKPVILFNYLGKFDNKENSEILTFSKVILNGTIDPLMERYVNIDFEGAIIDNKLFWFISFNSRAFKKETIEALLKDFRTELINILNYTEQNSSKLSLQNNFTYSNLNQPDLERISTICDIEIDNVKDIYMLSPMQEGMLYHNIYEERPNAYFEQFLFPVNGNLNVDIFKNSWIELFKRHDILRTNFIANGFDSPLQVVSNDRPCEFNYYDISEINEIGQYNFINDHKNRDLEKGFDLQKDVLMRIIIMKTDEVKHQIVWSYNHILIDGWSVGVLFCELFSIYCALKNEQEPELEIITPYSEYIQWILNRDSVETKDYWSNYLSGYEKPALLPFDLQSELNEFLPLTIDFTFSKQLTILINEIAVKNRVTINTVLQSLWGLLLCSYNHVDDVVFGAVVSGRPAEFPDVERIIGLFVNTIPVRVSFNRSYSFIDLIRKVQKESLAGGDHHYCSLAEIQNTTSLKSSLINHLLVFENYPFSSKLNAMKELVESGLTLGEVDSFEQTNYDLTVEVHPGEQIGIRFIYNANRLSPVTIESIRDKFEQIADYFISKPDINVCEIKNLFIDDKEKKEEELFLQSVVSIDDEF